MKYTTNLGTFTKGYVVTKNVPLDARLVQSTKNDLFDKTSFTISGLGDCRYEGMLVTVVDDTDVNNGVYLLIDESNKNNEAGWQKLLSLPPKSDFQEGDEIALKYDPTTHDFKWAKITPSGSGSGVDTLEDLTDVYVASKEDGQVLSWDASKNKWVSVTPINNLSDLDDVDVSGDIPNGYVLKWNGNKWIAAPDQRGSGSGGDAVTASDIDYRLVFTPTNQGGLGYTERGANGTGLGYLTKAHFASNGTQGIIPAGTSYEDIFRAVLEGEEQLDVNVTSKSVTYNASNQYFPIGNVTAQPSDASIQYSSSSTGPWTTYNNDIHGTNAGTYSGYFRVSKGGKVSSAKQANLVINKKSVTVTPDLVSTTKYIGETISFTSNSPIVSGAIGNDTNLIKSTINSYSGTKYTVSDSQPLNTVGTTSVLMTSQLINTLSNDYSNYSFSSGTKNVTVKPRIQYMTYLDTNTWKDHITSTTTYYSAPYDTLIGSVYPGIQSVGSGYYMLPFIHDTANGAFKLRIGAPYQLNPSDMKYWDTQNNIWKAKTSEQFNGFGNPRQYEENGITWNEYTYSGNTATSPLAISIQKQ